MTTPARRILRPNLFSKSPLLTLRHSSGTTSPFTKPSQPGAVTKSPTDNATEAAYPFTKPSPPTPVASSTRPVERPGPPYDPSGAISNEFEDPVDVPRPDYNVAEADYRTSTFSPIPMRVQEGSEDLGGLAPAAVTSGAPIDLQGRTVRIYKPAKTATQSGDWHGHHWQLDWDVLAKGTRWENPLMGWQSSADYVQGTKLNFKTKDDAIRFCQKQGYEWFVQEPNERRIRPKAYAEQFVHHAKPLKQVRTK
ncbi:MAG: hypothetical protein Q9162_005069 [Coniocarpon cinnabarinum]